MKDLTEDDITTFDSWETVDLSEASFFRVGEAEDIYEVDQEGNYSVIGGSLEDIREAANRVT